MEAKHELSFKELNDLGIKAYDQKKYQEAINYFKRARTLNSSSSSIWANLGHAHRKLNILEKAILYYDQALTLNPNNDRACYGKGMILYGQKKYDQALIFCKQGIKANANNAELRALKGLILKAMGHDEKAEKNFGRSLAIKPHGKKALQGREEIQKRKSPIIKAAVNNAGVIQLSIAIPAKELVTGKKLGEGGFGIVFKGEYKFSEVAIKKLKNQNLKAEMVEEFKKEASMMATLRSPHVAQLYGVCLEPSHYSMVMEFMPGGSLDKYLQAPGAISWKIRYQIGIDIGVGMAYLHGQDKVHCDLKSMNVLLDNNHRAKITDFGLSRTKSENSTYGDFTAGSVLWMAPELFEQDAKNSKEADVYTYGVTLWELGARKFPLSAAKSRMDIYNLVCGPNGRQEKITSDTPAGMARLIGKCWNKRTETRPKMEDAVRALKEEQIRLKY
jgi:hypothetical protein